MSTATLEEIAELRRLCTNFLIGHDTDEIGGSNANPFQGNMSYFRIRNVAPYQGASYTPEFV